jgi:hypothetical protein
LWGSDAPAADFLINFGTLNDAFGTRPAACEAAGLFKLVSSWIPHTDVQHGSGKTVLWIQLQKS